MTMLLLTFYPFVGLTHQPRPTEAKQRVVVHNSQRKPGIIVSSRRMVPSIIVKAYCCAYGLEYKIKPEYVIAVAFVESSKGHLEFRTWKTGRYFQPMGIFEGCRLGQDKSDLKINIEIGSMALARYGPVQDLVALKRALRSYNASFNNGYWLAICRSISKYEREGWR